MGIKYIALHMGYVESGSAATLLLENQTGTPFPTPKEALTHMAKGLFSKFLLDNCYVLEPRKHIYIQCCKNSLSQNSLATSCSVCGNQFDPKPITKSDFIYWVERLLYATADEWGGEDIPGWWPWITVLDVMKNATPDEVLCIPEAAAEVLTEFLQTEDVPEKYRSTIESWQNKPVEYYVSNQVLNDFGFKKI